VVASESADQIEGGRALRLHGGPTSGGAGPCNGPWSSASCVRLSGTRRANLQGLARGRSVDVVLRLFAARWPEAGQMTRAVLKCSLRAEADSLLAQLGRHLGATR